jgi:hypothetical protein
MIELIKLDDYPAIRAVLAFSKAENIQLPERRLKEMLLSDNKNVRIITALFIFDSFKSSLCKRILFDQVALSTYYYDVVTLFDILLFSPAKISASRFSEVMNEYKINWQ